jgi:hypothetical protein
MQAGPPPLQETLEADLAAGRDIAESATWAELLSDVRALVPTVRLFRGRPASGGPSPDGPGDTPAAWDAAAERYLATAIALMLREVVSRVVRGVYAIFAALLLLVAYQMSFLAYPRRAMVIVAWIYVVVGAATVIAAVVGTERDAVLSRLSGTSTGKIRWDAAFVQRTVFPLLFAVLTLFAMQFPDIGNTLIQGLRPVQTALP